MISVSLRQCRIFDKQLQPKTARAGGSARMMCICSSVSLCKTEVTSAISLSFILAPASRASACIIASNLLSNSNIILKALEALVSRSVSTPQPNATTRLRRFSGRGYKHHSDPHSCFHAELSKKTMRNDIQRSKILSQRCYKCHHIHDVYANLTTKPCHGAGKHQAMIKTFGTTMHSSSKRDIIPPPLYFEIV